MINKTIDLKNIKKIFSNKDQKMEYLKILFERKKINLSIPKEIDELNEMIIKTWDYYYSNKIIREMFERTEKYKNGKNAPTAMKKMISEWNALNFGEIKWPFTASGFDSYIQSINNDTHKTEEEKDEIVKEAIVRFRRKKKINTARNDFIEYLIVSNNEFVTPTLNHRRGVDFYINGKSFDQKVSTSVTNEFKRDFGEDWKLYAKKHPEVVAEYLYKYQDEGRFGDEPRLLIAYVDEDITDEDVYNCVKNTNFKSPIHISFEYNHAIEGIKQYDTDCYIVLLTK